MLRSQRSAELPPAKRRPKLPRVLRPRKKQKRLDAIRDEPTASFLAHRDPTGDDASNPRRSSRARRAPVVLDSSPVPSTSRKKHTDPDPPAGSGRKKIKWKEGKELTGGVDGEEKKKTVWQMGSVVGEDGEWRSRLRSRVGKGRGKSLSSFQESGRVLRNGRELLKPVTGEEDMALVSTVSRRCRSRKKVSTLEVSEVANEAGDQDNIVPVAEKDENNGPFAVKDSQVYEVGVASDTQASFHQAKVLESPDKIVRIVEQAACDDVSVQNKGLNDRVIENIVGPSHRQEMEDHGAEVYGSVQSGKHFECIERNGVERVDVFKGSVQEAEIRLKDDEQRVPMMDAKTPSFRIKEGRRCGLCGCGSDGKPPKRLVRESLESENEAYEGSSASEEPNYDVWDGFGDEPGWQGKLLGPIHDRFGIPRVWVHQNCAVWSPEVYFTGLRCLKNVRAALCRGRALKCSRCGRPGATIGCRVDRCPKTYHLPCSRVEGCIFDHRKFLIACSDHRKFFQPHGNKYFLLIKKMKAKKMRLDFRKISNEARRKDLDAEEKWLENCGEDEEFLKREGRRLHRDILRITPTYIGGSSDSEKLYQGWESVAGLGHVIQCMKEVVILPLLYPEFFANLGLVPPRGVLLHGYPGTGKTHVVRALIGACSRGDKKIAYFARKGADCLGKYVGDAERQLRLLFQVAERSQPSIIFFDEIDGLAPRRSKQQDQTHSSVVSTLLSLLDGLKSRGSVIVIGATNRPDAVDPALRRPGRFDREIYFPLPSLKDRSAILSLHTLSWPRPLSGSLLSWVANQTVGYAGADLQALCTHAVMHALKRKCALQQLLSFAEKGNIQGKLPCLPSFEVKERDWLAALAMAPPPCSRREAGIAANDVIASPLTVHLVSCLLLPLAHLLVSLYIDERIWLPPLLFEASKSVEEVIVSALEKKGVAMAFWWTHLNHLIEDPFIAGKIEKHFARCGLIIGSAGFNYPFILDEGSDVPCDNQKFESLKTKSSSIHMHREFMQKCPLSGNSLGFRTLISGAPRSGQQHLASCLLQGFLGHVEIRKVNLATISQEGHGDMVHGLSQILMKCLDVGRCVIYMPRVDLWAIEETTVPIPNVSQVTPKESKSSMAEKVHTGRKSASELWNSFAEHVHSACTAASLTILATCEVEHTDLPHGVRQFFSSGTCGHADSTPAQSTIPRFLVHLDGKFNHDLVINSAAVKLSYDLVRHYLMLMHERAHLRYSEDIHNVSNFEDIYSEAHKKNYHRAAVSEDQSQNAMARSTIISKSTSLDLDRIASNDGSSCRNDQELQGTKSQAVPQTTGGQYTRSRPYGFQGSFPRIGKVVKGNLVYAIETFGYQILRYPQLAELCWVTSKLNEGPCTDITGPWKGWPFNSCVMHTECSHDKVVSGANSGNVHDIESPGVVRGLIAVGLLAYRGYYASVREVSADVRKVLELLVGHIRAKIFDRKDRYRYFRILSQVAYLDDMVNSWAYMLQSLQVESTVSEAISKTRVVGRLEANDTNAESIIADNPSSFQHLESCNIVSEISQNGFVISNGECSNTTGKKVVEHSGAKGSLLYKGLNSVNQSPGLAVTGNIHNFEANRCNQNSVTLVAKPSEMGARGQCNDLEGVLPSYNAGCIPARHGDDANFSLLENGNISDISCLYNCCSKCTHMLNVLARKTISSYLKLNGSCSNMDDIHDIIVSCSLNLFNSFKKCWISDTPKIDGHFWRKAQCCSQPKEKDDCLERISCHCKTTEKMELLLTECHCHTRMEVSLSMADTGANSLFETTFKYFFRDGVLVPLVADKDPEFHCNFEKLCICSVVMTLLKIKQALDG